MNQLNAALLAATLIGVSASAVRADDAKVCTDGIAMIKAEIAKTPPKATLDKLNKALKGAEREYGEKEFDECVDFVNDAKKAKG
ncbi:MAG TPA: histidine kinase [Xanthobacteraceae bacterium]|nr:histidine kinase [Xanthobacteraceae bacterium]